MGQMIELKSGQPCQQTEPFTRYFEEIDLKNRTQLREAGCTVKRIKNDNPKETRVYSSNQTIQKVIFPAGTREEVKEPYAGMIRIVDSIYYLPDGKVFNQYQQGHESASLRRAEHYEQKDNQPGGGYTSDNTTNH
jgi:hypothetical protein